MRTGSWTSIALMVPSFSAAMCISLKSNATSLILPAKPRDCSACTAPIEFASAEAKKPSRSGFAVRMFSAAARERARSAMPYCRATIRMAGNSFAIVSSKPRSRSPVDCPPGLCMRCATFPLPFSSAPNLRAAVTPAP
ncbi:MAG: hypothetical protein IANPNBLG_04411 [Bryobacteraceae bacterium]|nr:hypothetical protein [Bryobacteraceae bacterium]